MSLDASSIRFRVKRMPTGALFIYFLLPFFGICLSSYEIAEHSLPTAQPLASVVAGGGDGFR